MMKWVFTAMVLLSVVFGIGCGQIDAVSRAAISSCGRAVELGLTLAGSMAMWSGVMKVAQESGLTAIIARLLSPITRRLFRGLDQTGKAMQYICMNITANLLGLGNAATPLGISAITELQKEVPTDDPNTASDHMITFVVLNTASIQLIPTTVATLRLQYGSSNPLDILPAVLLCSLGTVVAGISLTKLCNRLFPVKMRRPAL